MELTRRNFLRVEGQRAIAAALVERLAEGRGR